MLRALSSIEFICTSAHFIGGLRGTAAAIMPDLPGPGPPGGMSGTAEFVSRGTRSD
jgi:hypothetical protein